MQDAIAFYHELLSDELAQASQAMLADQLGRRGLVFGDRPLATVLRPRFMALAHYRRLQRRVRLLMRAFGKAYDRAVADLAVRAQFRLADWEERLVQQDPGFRASSPTSRVDAFVLDDTGEMALTEYNAETPAGAGYNDALVALIRGPSRSCARSGSATRPFPCSRGTACCTRSSRPMRSGPGIAERPEWRS